MGSFLVLGIAAVLVVCLVVAGLVLFANLRSKKD